MTIVCDTEPMVIGVCAPVAREGSVMPEFFDGGGHDGMCTRPFYDARSSCCTMTDLVQVRLGGCIAGEGRAFGMHLTGAMGTALVCSLRPSPSAPPRPCTCAPMAHLCTADCAIVKPKIKRPVSILEFLSLLLTPHNCDRTMGSSIGLSAAMVNHPDSPAESP